MNILDENIPKNQRQLLEGWGIPIRQIGFNVGRRGLQDDEIIPFLRRQRRPTFLTRDEDFYERRLCHAKYSLVYMAVHKNEAAVFVRRLLRHPEFDTQARRMGAVIRVSSAGLSYWQIHAEREASLAWEQQRTSN
ncbi:MAG: hypothetical protein HY872_18080 [Chloroflexi bacterium]|nr:hypothetical protein [Chloroflexota bacterium]